MSWAKLAESRIEEAIANGEFKDLPGHGQPLDLAEYFALSPAERAGAALLKNANVVPPEVQLLNEIASLEEAIQKVDKSHTACRSHTSQEDRLRNQLQEKRVAFALAMERRRRREPRALD